MKQRDARLEKKAGTGLGSVWSSGRLRQTVDSVPTAQPHLRYHNKDFLTPPCLLPPQFCMYVLE